MNSSPDSRRTRRGNGKRAFSACGRARSRTLLAFACLPLLFFAISPPTGEAKQADPVKQDHVAQDGHVQLKTIGVESVAPGEDFELVVEAKIDRGWHIYSTTLSKDVGFPTQFTVPIAGLFVQKGPVTESKPIKAFSKLVNAEVVKHERSARFSIPFSVPESVKAGTYTLEGKFVIQACDASVCLLPETKTFRFPVTVTGGAAKKAETKSEFAWIQKKRAEDDHPVLISAKGSDALEPGSEFVLEFETIIDRGWYIYSLYQDSETGSPTTITIDGLGPFERAGDIIEPKAKPKDAWGEMVLSQTGKVTFQVPLKVPAGTAPGEYPVKSSITFMVCNAETCLDVATVDFDIPMWVGMKRGDPVPGGAPGTGGSGAVALEIRKQVDDKVLLVGRGATGVQAGAEFELSIEATIERGFHLYGMKANNALGMPVQIEVEDPAIFEVLGVTESPPKMAMVNGQLLPKHEKKALFKIQMKAPADYDGSLQKVKAKITTQACDATICLLPQSTTFEFPVATEISAPGSASDPSGTRDSSSTSESTPASPKGPISFTATLERTELKEGEEVTLRFEGEIHDTTKRIPAIERDLVSEQGIWGIILLSMSGALIALLTPCVYPMIPITISVFTKQAEQKRSAVVGLALLFCAGVMGSFTSLGLILSAILGENGANFMATNPIINFAIGALFVYFAFSLFGYYDVQLPAFLRNRVAGAGGNGGVASVLVMGFVFSVTTFTCVGPIAAALLALAAGAGPGYAAIGMLAFSGTFALPFFFLALFPKALSGLPKSGGWLSTVKVVLGFIEILAAWKFFSATIQGVELGGVITREVIFAIWGITLVIMALYLLGKVKFPHDSPLEKIGAGRVTLVGVTLLCAAACFWAVAGKRWNENLESQLLVSSFYKSKGGVPWIILSKDNRLSFEVEIAKIREKVATGGEEKPIFINYTGHI